MKQTLSSEEKDEIIKRLREKGMRSACPMCGNPNFVLADGYFTHTIQADLSEGIVVGGPSLPTIAVICTRCGFTSQHALGALGLLNKPEEAKK